MAELPLVTVGVIAHEQGPFVSTALDSVIASDYPNLELLVIDDGSTDDTDAVIRGWLAAHDGIDAVHVRHPRPLGIGATLNEAIARARGAFLTGLAADDTLLPHGIRARVAYLLEHPAKLAVFADAEAMDADGGRLFASAIEGHYGGRRGELSRDASLALELVFHWAVPGPVFLCRRAAFDVVGSYDETVVTEDFDMYLRLAARGVLGYLDEPVARYRIHGGRMTARQHARMIADAARVAGRRARDFRGAPALRLRAQHHLFHARRPESGPGRFAFWALARAESVLALVGYQLARRRLASSP